MLFNLEIMVHATSLILLTFRYWWGDGILVTWVPCHQREPPLFLAGSIQPFVALLGCSRILAIDLSPLNGSSV